MTGIGSYFYIVWAVWLRRCLNDEQDKYMLKWPSVWFSLPEVIPRADAQKINANRNGYMNGSNGHAKEH
jgi:dihydroceramidase